MVSPKIKSRSAPIIWLLDESGELTPSVQTALGVSYRYQSFFDSEELLARLREAEPALIVTESELRKGCVSKLLNRLTVAPVIVISPCNDTRVISACLEQGAWDYILRPFDHNMLCAKVRLLLKRKGAPDPEKIDGLEFDRFTLTVSDPSRVRIKLTKKEFEILISLARSPEGITPAELRSQIWGNLKVVTKSLDVHLFKLRRKVEPVRCQVEFTKNGKYRLIRK